MNQAIIERYRWTCPKCKREQVETVLEEDGPFWTCTCERCSAGFDRDNIETWAEEG